MCGVNYQWGWCRWGHMGGLTLPGPDLSLSPLPPPQYLRRPKPHWLLGNLFPGWFKLLPITCKYPPPFTPKPIRMLSTSTLFLHRVLGAVNHLLKPQPPSFPHPWWAAANHLLKPSPSSCCPISFLASPCCGGTGDPCHLLSGWREEELAEVWGAQLGAVTGQCLFSLYSPEEKILNYSFSFMAFVWSVHILPSERAVTRVLVRQIIAALGRSQSLCPGHWPPAMRPCEGLNWCNS